MDETIFIDGDFNDGYESRIRRATGKRVREARRQMAIEQRDFKAEEEARNEGEKCKAEGCQHVKDFPKDSYACATWCMRPGKKPS